MNTVALIGCGRISFKHIEAFVKNADCMTLIACCDPKTERAQVKADEYCKALPSAVRPAVYDDYRKMLSEAVM